jgi:arylsulfatase A-like enzyme
MAGLVGGLAPAADGPARARPDVVLLYADDLGYGDVHCNNPDRGRIPTPCIDRLATEGLRFTDAHSSSGVCSPSRYTLLTGRYHWRTRLQAGIVGAWERPLIAADRLTIASLARRHGYRTAAIGKWHLGWEWPIDQADREFVIGLSRRRPKTDEPPSAIGEEHRAAWRRTFSRAIGGGPTTRGFDSYFGTDVPNWPPYCFLENDRTRGIPDTILPADDLRGHRASLQGPALTGWRLEDVLPAMRDRAVRFIEEAARGDRPYLLYMPLTSPHTPLAVNAPWKLASGLDNACADLVMETDAVIGEVLAAIDRGGRADRTLVILTSDNGFAPYVGARDLESRGHFPSGPYRGYKSDVWEGGHRVPFIVRWPGSVEAGTVCDALVHQADILATLADILGEPLPPDAGEDSFSLLPLLRGDSTEIRRHAVSCSARGLPGIREGRWKLILGSGSGGWSPGGEADRVQLYDLAHDPGETRSLAAEEPERVAAITDAYARIVDEGRSTPGPRQPNDVPVRLPPAARVSPEPAPGGRRSD